MRRMILASALLLVCVAPALGQYGWYGGHRNRDAQRTVERWYRRFLDREADPYAGGWIQALQQGQSREQVLAGILGSDEYYRKAGARPAPFVRELYQDLMGRNPRAEEVRYWVNQLYHHSRTDVAYSLLTRTAGNWDWDDDDRDWRDRYDYRRPYHRYR